jgi:phospholipid-translocating ATPase
MRVGKSPSNQQLLDAENNSKDALSNELENTFVRHIYVNAPLPPHALTKRKKPKTKYPSNEVITSKYTLLSFLPKNLFEQFRRLANAFFSLIVVLQFFPTFETINPVVSGLPLFIILLMTAGKDAFEDWKRHLSDNQVNNHVTYIMGNWKNVNYSGDKTMEDYLEAAWERIKSAFGRNKKEADDGQKQAWEGDVPSGKDSGKVYWKKTPWKNIQVGDIIYLRDNDPIPADILILATSEPDCLCYVETKNLDGETNLKIRRGLAETAHLQTPVDCNTISLRIDSEAPNSNLYTYHAVVAYLANGEKEIGRVPVTINQILLRGCILRNTDFVIGVVLFNGKDTKISLNTGATPSKRSLVEKQMNLQMYSSAD